MNKQTPGPWYVADKQPGEYWWVKSNQETVAAISLKGNTTLIAAAPQLLDVARHAETALTLADRSCTDSPEGAQGARCMECVGCALETVLLIARSAIARATGEAQ